MRKTYSKPEIMFEDFTLNESIATNCEIRISNQSVDVCGMIQGSGGEVLFIDDSTGCTMHTADTEANGLCYHVPVESNNLFNS